MKNYFLLPMLFFLMVFSVKAQNTTFTKGDKVLNLGLGLGGVYYSGIYSNKIPPVSASLEYCILDNLFDENGSLGVGGYLGYTGAKWAGTGYGYSYSNIRAAGQAAFHYQFIDKLDTYTGIMFGYMISNTTKVDRNYPGNYYVSMNSEAQIFLNNKTPVHYPILKASEVVVRPLGGVFFAWRLGARYYITNNLAGFMELGWGVAYITIGASLKF